VRPGSGGLPASPCRPSVAGGGRSTRRRPGHPSGPARRQRPDAIRDSRCTAPSGSSRGTRRGWSGCAATWCIRQSPWGGCGRTGPGPPTAAGVCIR
jgi:hypothetical protein